MRIMKELLGDIPHQFIHQGEEISLHGVSTSGPDQEAYILIRHEQNQWKVFLVQRGKSFQRYQTENKDVAEVCACLLFRKDWIRFAPFSWAETDKLVREGQLADAICQVDQEVAASVPVSIENDQAGWHVLYQGNILYSCANTLEALRAYRCMRLLYQHLSEACDRALFLCPQLAEERDRMLLAIIK